MKRVLKWIVLCWTIITIPYVFVGDPVEIFGALLYAGLIIGLIISDLKEGDKKVEK